MWPQRRALRKRTLECMRARGRASSHPLFSRVERSRCVRICCKHDGSRHGFLLARPNLALHQILLEITFSAHNGTRGRLPAPQSTHFSFLRRQTPYHPFPAPSPAPPPPLPAAGLCWHSSAVHGLPHRDDGVGQVPLRPRGNHHAQSLPSLAPDTLSSRTLFHISTITSTGMIDKALRHQPAPLRLPSPLNTK